MNRPALSSVFSDQRRTNSTTRSRTSCGTHSLVRAPQDFFLRPCAQPSIRPAPHPSSGSSFPGTRSVVVRLGGPDGSWTGRQPPRSRRTLFANGRTPLAAAPVPHTDRKPALYPANAVLGCQPSLRQCSASALFACVLSVILTEERSLQFQLRQDSLVELLSGEHPDKQYIVASGLSILSHSPGFSVSLSAACWPRQGGLYGTASFWSGTALPQRHTRLAFPAPLLLLRSVVYHRTSQDKNL